MKNQMKLIQTMVLYIPKNFARDDLSETDDSEDLVALLEFNDDHDMTSELSDSDAQTMKPNDAYIHDAILSIKQTGRFSYSTKNQSTVPHLSAATTANQTSSIINTESYHKEATTSHIRLNKIWKKQLKAKQKAREKMLNGEEGEHEDQNFAEATNVNRNVVDLDDENQLLMCVPGSGGTGKSQLIHAIIEYLSITKRSHELRKLTPTSNAAAQIDGLTIHSFTSYRNLKKISAVQRTTIEKEWRHVRYIIIDEMSMVGVYLLGQLGGFLTLAKHCSPNPNHHVKSLDTDEWKKAPILVFRNELRAELNIQATASEAFEKDVKPL
ncbi:unnamed protein product, partial [Didymodactylos carnosus]